jgi:hypothetical protein
VLLKHPGQAQTNTDKEIVGWEGVPAHLFLFSDIVLIAEENKKQQYEPIICSSLKCINIKLHPKGIIHW